MNARGDAIVGWSGAGTYQGQVPKVEVATQPAGGLFGVPQRVFDRTAFAPILAVNAAGEAVTEWTESGPQGPGPQWRSDGGIGGGFATATRVAEGGIGSARPVAVGPAGDVLAVGSRYGDAEGHTDNPNHQNANQVVAAIAPRGKPFAPPVVVSDNEVVHPPSAAFLADGSALVAWSGRAKGDTTYDSSGGPLHVYVAIRSPDGSWGPAQLVSDPARPVESTDPPTVTAGTRGDALVAWRDAASRLFAPTLIEAAVRPPGAPFGAPETVTTSSELPGITATLDARGNALVAFRDSAFPATAYRPAGGAFGARQSIVDPTISTPDVAFDSEGNAAILWTTWVQDSQHKDHSYVRAAVRTANGTVTPAETVLEGGLPQLAFDAFGRGLLTSASGEYGHRQIFVVGYDAGRLAATPPAVIRAVALTRSTHPVSRVAIRYVLRKPSALTLSLDSQRRRPGRACARRNTARCLRYVALARTTSVGQPGRVRSAVLAPRSRRRLASGRYRVTVVAADAAGRPIQARWIEFRL